MGDISNLRELVSRYMVNHFVVGYFALFVIYKENFIKNNLLFQIIMAIVASYLLFIPARFIVRLTYGEGEDDKPCTIDKMKDKRIIYKFYHLRIYSAFIVLSTFYFTSVLQKIIKMIPIGTQMKIHVVIFILL